MAGPMFFVVVGGLWLAGWLCLHVAFAFLAPSSLLLVPRSFASLCLALLYLALLWFALVCFGLLWFALPCSALLHFALPRLALPCL